MTRKNPPSDRQKFIEKTAAELVKRAEPPMGIRMARFHARGLWDRKQAELRRKRQ